MRFEKWQALGNDYVIVEERELPFDLSPARIERLCAPHTGIGSDGVLLLSAPPDDDVVARVRIFNPDGSEAELSGNGVRQAVLYLRSHGWTEEDRFAVATAAGEVTPTITGIDTCETVLGRARLASDDFPDGPKDGASTLTVDDRQFDFRHVQVGNPQCAIEVGGELGQLDVARYGAAIERHEIFPNRTNVSFWRSDSDGEITARIFERGVGETLSSGTGASGAAVAAVLGGATSPVTVHLDGGDLDVDVSDELDVTLTGWAVPVFAGTLSTEMTEAVRRS